MLIHVLVFVIVVEESKKRLVAAGFQELREADHWNIKPQSKVFR